MHLFGFVWFKIVFIWFYIVLIWFYMVFIWFYIAFIWFLCKSYMIIMRIIMTIIIILIIIIIILEVGPHFSNVLSLLNFDVLSGLLIVGRKFQLPQIFPNALSFSILTFFRITNVWPEIQTTTEIFECPVFSNSYWTWPHMILGAYVYW